MNVSYGLIDDRHAKMGFFDIEGARIPFSRNDYEAIEELDFPAFFPQMVEDARTLSKDFSFVRVDFFVVREKYYFAEMTFTPGGGMITFNPSVYDAEWGAQLDIAKEMQLYGRNSRIGK